MVSSHTAIILGQLGGTERIEAAKKPKEQLMPRGLA
jgi:hypothetical protein